MLRRAVKVLGAGAGAASLGTAGWVYCDEGRRRGMYGLWVCGKIMAHYQYSDYMNSSSSEVEKSAIRLALDRRYAPEVLKMVLDLKGYYIKCAQTLVGAAILPKEYEDVLSPLLDDCPSEPFDVVRSIVEEELGCPIADVFRSFDEQPLGAASIGQVHRAELLDGTPVVVKVQYPSVENYFRIDLATMKTLMAHGDFKEAVTEMMDGLSKTFAAEFDYTKEADFLRRCADNVTPEYRRRVCIPLPVDGTHPAAAAGRSLCTRKVLTMEALPGEPIKRKVQKMMEAWAAEQGKSVAELKADMAAEFSDPEKLAAATSAAPASEAAVAAGIAVMRVRERVSNALRFAYNVLFGWLLGRVGYVSSAAELLNGPAIIRLLADFHAHQIFVDGLFNTDPHAGNVLVMPDDRLGLIDYGAAAELAPEQQRSFARLIVAIADDDHAAIVPAMREFGWVTERGDQLYIVAYSFICYHRMYNLDDMHRIGVPAEVGVADLELWLSGRDKLLHLPDHILLLQRCVMVLLGMAQEIGASGISVAQMWRPHAARYLAAHADA